jgi:hypothetical protein
LTSILDKIANSSNSESIDFITEKGIKEGAKLDNFLQAKPSESENYNQLSGHDYYILDIGPSHPHYHRVARKKERLKGEPSFNVNLASQAYIKMMADKYKRQTLQGERGEAAISEPMIALGMDPSNFIDTFNYKRALKCAMALQGNLDLIKKLERDAFEQAHHDKDNKKYGWDHESQKFLGLPPNRSKRNIMMDMGIPGHCAELSSSFLEKILKVQADNLRPMPAYTPSESEAELQAAGVDVENLMESRYRKRLNRRERYFVKFMLSENRSKELERNVKNFLTEVRSGKYLINEFKELPPGCFDEETMQVRNFSPITGQPCFEISEYCYNPDGSIGNYNAADGSLCPGHPNWKYPMNVLNENKNCGCSSCSCDKSKKRNYKMKVTKSQLRRLINETISEALDPGFDPKIAELNRDLIDQLNAELKRINHPLPHVVINNFLMDLTAGEHPARVFNKYLMMAHEEVGSSPNYLVKGGMGLR